MKRALSSSFYPEFRFFMGAAILFFFNQSPLSIQHPSEMVTTILCFLCLSWHFTYRLFVRLVSLITYHNQATPFYLCSDQPSLTANGTKCQLINMEWSLRGWTVGHRFWVCSNIYAVVAKIATAVLWTIYWSDCPVIERKNERLGVAVVVQLFRVVFYFHPSGACWNGQIHFHTHTHTVVSTEYNIHSHPAIQNIHY